MGASVYMPDIEGDDGAARAYYVPLLPFYNGNLKGSRCRNLKGFKVTRSQDCINPVRNLKIGMQFRDSENAQRNLEIAQIPTLHGTSTLYIVVGTLTHSTHLVPRPSLVCLLMEE